MIFIIKGFRTIVFIVLLQKNLNMSTGKKSYIVVILVK